MIPQALTNGVEIYVEEKQLKVLQNGVVLNWENVSVDLLTLIREDLECDPVAMATVAHIKDPVQQLEVYARCRYGGFSCDADFRNGKVSGDYFDCGRRGACQYEGKRCKGLKATYGILTATEMDVLRFIARGMTNDEIAVLMCKSANTVDVQRSSIREKIGGKQADVVRFAVEKGLI